MEIFIESLREEWSNFLRLSPRVVLAVLIMVLLILAGRIAGRTLMHVLRRGQFSPTHRDFFRSLTTWVFGILGAIVALNVLGLKSVAASLVAGGGMTAIVLGFAFRGIGENFLAGFFLAFSRPFEIGNLIKSGEFQGVVKGIELRSTHIRTADGRDIFIPSAQLFNDPIVNYTVDGLRRLSFKVGIDYGDDPAAARQALLEATRSADRIIKEPEPGVLVATLAPQYLELEVFFWIDMFGRGSRMESVRTEVMERCRQALIDRGITLSSNVSSNIALSGRMPVEIRMEGSQSG